jgi:hypothetical protein
MQGSTNLEADSNAAGAGISPPFAEIEKLTLQAAGFAFHFVISSFLKVRRFTLSK